MENRGHNLNALRQLNVRAVLGSLLDNRQPLTVRDIAIEARVSRPTVESSLAALADGGIVAEIVDTATAGRLGRPARTYGIQASNNLIVALDVGPHGIKAVLTDVRGIHLHGVISSERDLRAAPAAFSAIVGIIDRLLAETPHQRKSVGTIAVGIPGIVSNGGESLVSTVVPDWAEANLIPRIRAEFPDADVLADNDVKLAALGEREQGSLRRRSDGIFLLLGKRMSAAAFINGQLVRGTHGGAGELGAWKMLGWDTAYNRLRNNPAYATSRAVFAAAEGGDKAAQAATDTYAKDIAEGLTALVLTLDPSIIILGGSIAGENSHLREMVQRHLAPACLFPPDIEYSSLGSDAVTTGAVALATTHARNTLLAIQSHNH